MSELKTVSEKVEEIQVVDKNVKELGIPWQIISNEIGNFHSNRINRDFIPDPHPFCSIIKDVHSKTHFIKLASA
jgi:hypothetical protein